MGRCAVLRGFCRVGRSGGVAVGRLRSYGNVFHPSGGARDAAIFEAATLDGARGGVGFLRLGVLREGGGIFHSAARRGSGDSVQGGTTAGDAEGVFVDAVVCAILFPYRWWAIDGIGGYTAGDAPTFLRPNPLHAANGLFFRAWGFFFFPINWSGAGLSKLEVSALVVYQVVLAAMVCVVRARRDLLLCAVAFSGAVLLPVYQMILIASDLAGGVREYAPTIGLAILVAAVFASQPIRRAGRHWLRSCCFRLSGWNTTPGSGARRLEWCPRFAAVWRTWPRGAGRAFS